MVDQSYVQIFISYRRADSQDITGRIHDRLADEFGEDNIFFDISDIKPGDEFPEHIKIAAENCKIMLVIIRDDWIDIKDEYGKQRLDDPEDWVRREVQIGLSKKKKIIPILINDTQMPRKSQLPRTLRSLARNHAARVRSGSDQ